MNNKLTIGQLSKLVGLSTKTIRFYEEIKLLTPGERTENGYRVYDPTIIENLKLIKNARDLGLPIAEIRKLMVGCTDNCGHTKEYIASEIDGYLKLLTEKINQLTTLRRKMQNLQTNLKIGDTCTTDTYCCNVLHQLSTIEKGGEQNG